jgi:hypothetical protein
MPFTLQVTDVFDAPVTEAVNCCVLPSKALEPEDVTATVTTGGVVIVNDPAPPPHP